MQLNEKKQGNSVKSSEITCLIIEVMFLERTLCVFVVLGSEDTVAVGLEEQPTPIKSLPFAGQGLGLRPPRELCPRPGTCGAGLRRGLSTPELLSSCCFGTSVLLWFCFYFYFLS